MYKKHKKRASLAHAWLWRLANTGVRLAQEIRDDYIRLRLRSIFVNYFLELKEHYHYI